MKKIVAIVIVVILFSGCTSEEEQTEPKTLDLEIGETHTYEFFMDGNKMGHNTYKVVEKEEGTYKIESEVKITTPIQMELDATYTVTEKCNPLHYEFVAYVNSEKQTVSCEFTKGRVHEVATKGDNKFEKDITLEPNTYLLDNNMIGQWALMFRIIELEANMSKSISMFAAQPMKALKITMEVEGTEELKGYNCDVVNFPELGYVMYVSDGTLLQMETKDKSLVIALKE